MGMFDYVNVEMDCPVCGNRLSEFQSKDGYCTLDTIDPDAVDNFYTSCDECSSWVEFSRKRKTKKESRDTPYSYDEVIELGFELE